LTPCIQSFRCDRTLQAGDLRLQIRQRENTIGGGDVAIACCGVAGALPGPVLAGLFIRCGQSVSSILAGGFGSGGAR
jgi:hypothetical protein